MADITTMQDLLQLQQDLKDRLVKKLDLTSLGKSAAFDAMIANQTADIGRAKAALDNATKERETIVKYWDDRIARLGARVDTLSKGLKQTQEQIKPAGKENAKTKAPAKKSPSP